MTIKGRLYNTRLRPRQVSNGKGVLSANFYVPSKTGPQMAVFGEKRGVKLNVWFCDLQNAHPCAEPRLLTYFASKSVRASWL